jgi:glycosyltransferase involved in cell wall biosynthesis
MRALWERTHAEINGMPGFMAGSIRRFFTELRLWDYIAAARVDQFIANSTITRRRIAAFYRRDAVVITPPIETERFTVGNVPAGDYYLVASRNVPYKKIDLAIAAAEQLGRRLIVMGEGTDKLTSSSPLIEFRGKVSGDEFLNLMRGAKALLAPQIEDFGMSILEANACGRPVIALARGGALETLIDGHTGVLFEEQTVESLTDAIIRFERTAFDTAAIRRNAERFSQERFIANVRELVLRVHNERLQQEPRSFDLPTQLVSASG